MTVLVQLQVSVSSRVKGDSVSTMRMIVKVNGVVQCQAAYEAQAVWEDAYGVRSGHRPWLGHKQVSVLVTQSCPNFCDPMECSPQNSSVHGFSRWNTEW